MRDAVPFPLPSGLACHLSASHTTDGCRQFGVPTQSIDQRCVLMHDGSIIGNSFRIVNPEELAVATGTATGQNFRTMSGDALPQSYLAETAKRCVATRVALGFRNRPPLLRDLLPYADDAEVNKLADRVRKYEDGTTEPGAWYTRLLKRFYGVGADWLLHGDPRAIDDHDLRRKIDIAMHDID